MTTITIPLDVAEAAAEALCNFVSDHGWADSDMQAMDNLDAYIQRHKASRTELAKPVPVEQNWNRSIRDSVDALLAEAGYEPDSSARHQLAMMNFDQKAEGKPL